MWIGTVPGSSPEFNDTVASPLFDVAQIYSKLSDPLSLKESLNDVLFGYDSDNSK